MSLLWTSASLTGCPLLGTLSENGGPVFFLSLLGVCALMIVGAVIVDLMPERVPKAADAEEDDGEVEEPAGKKADKKAAALAKSKAKAAAKAEAKAKKKQQDAERKAAKGKGKEKGKSKGKESPPAEAAEPAEPVASEPVDFGDPEPPAE